TWAGPSTGFGRNIAIPPATARRSHSTTWITGSSPTTSLPAIGSATGRLAVRCSTVRLGLAGCFTITWPSHCWRRQQRSQLPGRAVAGPDYSRVRPDADRRGGPGAGHGSCLGGLIPRPPRARERQCVSCPDDRRRVGAVRRGGEDGREPVGRLRF